MPLSGELPLREKLGPGKEGPLHSHMAVCQNQWDPILGFSVHHPLTFFLVVGLNRMFTEGAIWILTHDHIHRGARVWCPPLQGR